MNYPKVDFGKVIGKTLKYSIKLVAFISAYLGMTWIVLSFFLNPDLTPTRLFIIFHWQYAIATLVILLGAWITTL